MTERGVVVKINGKKATVRFERRSACDKCHMCAVTKDGMKVEVVVDNALGANVGDFVEVEMGERYVLTAAAIVYVIPLVLVGVGVGIGTILSELAQVLIALGGLVAGFAIAFVLDRFVIRKKKGFCPVMKAICPDGVQGYMQSASTACGNADDKVNELADNKDGVSDELSCDAHENDANCANADNTSVDGE